MKKERMVYRLKKISMEERLKNKVEGAVKRSIWRKD